MKKRNETYFVKSIDSRCYECNGSCWNPNSQADTQRKCKEKFGTIVNDCVNGQSLSPNISNVLKDSAHNVVRCPYALGLLH